MLKMKKKKSNQSTIFIFFVEKINEHFWAIINITYINFNCLHVYIFLCIFFFFLWPVLNLELCIYYAFVWYEISPTYLKLYPGLYRKTFQFEFNSLNNVARYYWIMISFNFPWKKNPNYYKTQAAHFNPNAISMAATIFQDLRLITASIFTRGSPKSRIQYDPTCFLARFAVDQYNKKEVLFLQSLTFFFCNELFIS